MGYLLKEALKTLCGVNQWAYAVFWKIGYQNPKLLIWEECYYEPVPYSGLPGSSGAENPELGFEDWSSTKPKNSQLAVQAGNRVHFLVNKMMMDNHVNVLGEGLVGRAAFTGSHQWILPQNYAREAHPPEVLKEVFQQFSAGMQTIAVIPVLPHGVVQLGSDIAIMENMAFVNGVKTLVLQLGCVPGVLLSENYATKESGPKNCVPACLGNSIPGMSSERSMMINSTPLVSDSYDYKSSLAETATYVGQTSCLVGQVRDVAISAAATFQASNMSPSFVTPHASQYQAKVGDLTDGNLPSSSQLAIGVVKAEVIPSNPEVWFNQQTPFYIPRSTSNQQPSICSSAKSNRGLSLGGQQISADMAVQSAVSNSNLSDSLMMSILGTNADLDSYQDYVAIPPANPSELYGVAKSNLESLSNLGQLSDAELLSKTKTGAPHAESEFQSASSSKSSLSLCKVVNNSSTTKLSACSSVNGYHSADDTVHMDLAEMNGRLENDMYQALSVPLSGHNKNTGLSEHIPCHIYNGTNHEYRLQNPSARDAGNGDACAQPCAGDDLFDVLGADFKNKLFSCSWNNSETSELDTNIRSLEKKNSVLMKGSDAAASADTHFVKEGHSDSSLFSGAGTDHLLDAVISRMQPSTKQILDDNISCRTSLTNSSSSSPPNASKSSSQVYMLGQMRGELFGFPKSLGKPGVRGSCSFRSGPCKDNGAGYSQSSSLYESQISSWVEQGSDVKPSSSVSTAYSKKADDASKTSRKRLKPGENPRPRPKDRQMIQDRVKELREIVPNGAKCSIDALLERTIKHMLFLQSVTKHADKLKQGGESKIIGKEGGQLIKDNNEGGATWAYEVGSQSMVCPIIVEDLNQPRQMLVELLCEERGLFLEIADIIRGLGLTILKGVMETRNDKIWARFAVEANRDVTRMEIFMSLVRLLEQTVKNGVVPVHGIDNDSLMVPQFLQPTSIHSSARPCSLQ